ncbi:hypothetical protein [Janthinobacterium aquaticum]|uniref:hypothetical protein n=1 Tax=Janthinobacterium sp. FT58W TaxID=2654254 RepID=UPI00126535B7|nr:hypothetical protein [Janthinobacterium sp. FT58W]KAB8042570.1 hypothetical protein GCM43_13690 [Janthinobacterium sp. FT58W]
MTKQAMFTPNADGYDISPAGVLLLCADTVYGDPAETTPEGIRNARAMMESLLSAARAGGYTQGDVLHTLLARKQLNRRVMDMAQAACDAAGAERLAMEMRDAGLQKGGAH